MGWRSLFHYKSAKIWGRYTHGRYYVEGRSINKVVVAIPRLAAKPIVTKPNVDCNYEILLFTEITRWNLNTAVGVGIQWIWRCSDDCFDRDVRHGCNSVPVDDFDLEVWEVDYQSLLNLLNTVLDQTVSFLFVHIWNMKSFFKNLVLSDTKFNSKIWVRKDAK